MTVARQGRRGARGWPRTGLVGEWTFESSDGTDTSPVGLNTLALTNTAIVAGINGLALDTQTVGYATKTGITADLKTTTGTLHRYFKRADLSKTTYISFSENGVLGDEMQFLVRGNAIAAPNGVQLVLFDGGVEKINYLKLAAITNTNFHLLSLTADGNEYSIYLDGVLLTGLIKDSDDPVYRGMWVGATEMAGMDTFTIGGVQRATMLAANGYTVEEFTKQYNYAQTATEIADLYAIIGGEK